MALRPRLPRSSTTRAYRFHIATAASTTAAVLLLVLAVGAGAAAAAAVVASIADDRLEERTTAPIIGIFAQPSHAAEPPCDGHCEYIAASYVKWIESAGGRAVPIPYNASAPVLDALFDRINGLLLPGGGNPLPDAAVHMIRRAVAANDAGDYFPVWATCLGLEWLLQALGGQDFALDTALDAWNVSLPLEYTSEAAESRLFRRMDSALFAAAGTEPLAMNNHHKGCSPAHFQANTRLAAAFALLSTNHDRRGQPFVSTIEARKWPMWGVQWHPEKPVFEWGTVPDPVTGAPLAYEAINHSEKAQEMAQFMGGFFLAHAKQSGHTFPTQVQEEAALMYNFAAVPSGPAFVQSYFFTEFPAYEVYEARGGSGAVGQEQQRRKRRAALPSLRGS